MQLKNIEAQTEEKQSKTLNIDKAIFIGNGGGYFNNGGFFTGFSQAFKEIVENKDLGLRDIRLLLLIMSYMGEKEMMITSNRQRLLDMKVYAKEIGLKSRSDVNKSFLKLEEMGYFKRDKGDKSLELMVNPAMAYSGKTRDFSMVWNELAIPFGNKKKKIQKGYDKPIPLEDGKDDQFDQSTEQDWSSDGEKELKKTMKQHNIDGGIDDVEIL